MIVKLRAPLKNYLWGGTKLKSQWHKQSDDIIAESWELSFCDGSESVIDGGKYDGKRLNEIATRNDFGKNCDKFQSFPTLIKLIDAQQNLSVQVHPSDEYALKHEHQYGKTEMWHVLDAEKGAKLYLGLNKSMSKDEFLAAVSNGTVMNCLNAVSVKAGDTYFVESGTLHAIGAGITLIEIQQSSTLTYRVYDYNRVDKDGNPRQLHLEKAMQVANLQKYDVPNPERQQLLGSCEYFTSYRIKGNNSYTNSDSFSSATVTDGQIDINGMPLKKGETVFISAGEHVEIQGCGTYILTCVD